MSHKIIKEFIYPANQAKIAVYLQDHEIDQFVLKFERKPDCDIEIAMRPDEALLVATLLTQSVLACCAEYKVSFDDEALPYLANFNPEKEI